MRAKVAKRIKKSIYGSDMSTKERKYLTENHIVTVDGKRYRQTQTINTGLRAKYLKAKDEYKHDTK